MFSLKLCSARLLQSPSLAQTENAVKNKGCKVWQPPDMSSLMYYLWVCFSYIRVRRPCCLARVSEPLQSVKPELPWCRLKVLLSSLFTFWPTCACEYTGLDMNSMRVNVLQLGGPVRLIVRSGWEPIPFCPIHLGSSTSPRALVVLFWLSRRDMRTGPDTAKRESRREGKLNTKRQEGRTQMSLVGQAEVGQAGVALTGWHTYRQL